MLVRRGRCVLRYLAGFGIDLGPYDVVKGYRADDSYFSFVRAFLNNTLSVGQVAAAMRLGGAFDRLRFRGYTVVSSRDYYPLRMRRDASARRAFREECSTVDYDGLYIRDLMRERVREDDPRIR